MDSLFNVSVDSLAQHVGITNDTTDNHPDVPKGKMLKMQLGILQRKSNHEQTLIYYEFAAKHLPALVGIYKANDSVLSPSTTLLNVLSHTPHFVRFIRTPAGQSITAIQAKRTAQAASSIGSMGADDVGEIGQFLSTLLVLQGTTAVDELDKTTLIPYLKEWKKAFPGRLASETSGRCLDQLTGEVRMNFMAQSLKKMLEKCLNQCGDPNCERSCQQNGSELLQCSRCKSAVYVSKKDSPVVLVDFDVDSSAEKITKSQRGHNTRRFVLPRVSEYEHLVKL